MVQAQQNLEDPDQGPALSVRLAEMLSDLAFQDDDGGLQLVELHEGDILFEQGDDADSVYVLKAGVLGVRIRHADGSESDIARLVPGAIVGEMALLSGSRRSATVYAINDAGLICVTDEQFQQLMEADKSALEAVSATAIPRWQRQQLSGALNKLLGDLDAAELEVLQKQLTWHYFANGDFVFKQGDSSDGMYIVVNGRLRTTLTREDGTEKELGQIGAGEPAGEMGLLTDAPRSATVHAVRESNLVKITPASFRRLIRQYPEMMINVARVIVQRQQRIMRGAEQKQLGSLTLAVIPASTGMDAALFGQELSHSLARYGSTLALDGDRFDELYGEMMASQTELDGIGNTAIVAWMNELELTQQIILYIADPFDTPWTRRCIGHADRVLILADTAGEAAPGEAERVLDELEVPVKRDLLFWQPAGSGSPRDAGVWLELRAVDGVYYNGRGDGEQMDALAKRVVRGE